MSITASDVSYHYPNREKLFDHLSFSVSPYEKVSIIGNNGTGKSTLLKLLAGELEPSSGIVRCSRRPYHVPQQIGITGKSVSEALCVEEKIMALQAVDKGSCSPAQYDLLKEDWDIESRCRSALDFWGLYGIDLSSSLDSLSGGEKSKVLLAGLLVHKPAIILLDEPTNHLDYEGRGKLYEYVTGCKSAIVVVSHDIALLDLLGATYELTEKGMKAYGGNYSFYRTQKEIEEQAIARQISSEEAGLRLARKKTREVRERQDRRTARGRCGKSKGGVARIVMNARANLAENSSAKISERQSGIIEGKLFKLSELRNRQRMDRELMMDFESSGLHKGKLLIEAVNVNFGYSYGGLIWETPLDFEIRSGERIRITGNNGAGKTTLIRLITGELHPSEGRIGGSDFSYIYLDQQYSQVDKDLTVLELANEYNRRHLQEQEVRLRLDRALFPEGDLDKNCRTLSGGERMRLYLCCLMISNQSPDMIILDEPGNNLDIASLSILEDTVGSYQGTVIVISHDDHFVGEIGTTRTIELESRIHPGQSVPVNAR